MRKYATHPTAPTSSSRTSPSWTRSQAHAPPSTHLSTSYTATTAPSTSLTSETSPAQLGGETCTVPPGRRRRQHPSTFRTWSTAIPYISTDYLRCATCPCRNCRQYIGRWTWMMRPRLTFGLWRRLSMRPLLEGIYPGSSLLQVLLLWSSLINLRIESVLIRSVRCDRDLSFATRNSAMRVSLRRSRLISLFLGSSP